MYKGLWAEAVEDRQGNSARRIRDRRNARSCCLRLPGPPLPASSWDASKTHGGSSKRLRRASRGASGYDFPRAYLEMVVAQLELTRGESEKALYICTDGAGACRAWRLSLGARRDTPHAWTGLRR